MWSLQVVKPVNLEAMSKWVGAIPDDVVEDMANIAPMLAKMGYDPNANPPKYGDPDPEVLRNTNDVKEHNDVWEAKGEMVKSLSKKDGGKWTEIWPRDLNLTFFQKSKHQKKWLWLYFTWLLLQDSVQSFELLFPPTSFMKLLFSTAQDLVDSSPPKLV